MTTITTRARRSESDTSYFRRWRSRDGRYAVVECKSKFGLPTRYLVVERAACGNECVVSRHRKRSAAVAAIEKLVRSAT